MDYAEKLKLAHDSYDAFNRKDLETLLQLYDPECEWHMSNFPVWPEKRIYRGREGLAEFFDNWLDPSEEFYVEIKQVTNLPGDRALVIGYNRGRARLSGAQVELPPIAQIVDFRGGRILRIDNYLDVEEARKAAGPSAQEVHADS